ncbi:hypothetical protein [Fibrella aquatilis]|uniref:DUF4843 domain-containing protein n=1 Tax=Fibrella aquatilis TaxID=2817059 RepID=A0A939G3V9_9BACT|nr:hypothetical protein [Fibrella aquatilis]MBO0929511.1 hypothetical protein [Fibrella aquatilis]
MKKVLVIAVSVLSLLGLYACDNSLNKTFDPATPFVEFQPAVLTANSVGRFYPLISTGNSVTAGSTQTAQLNLVGRQRSSELTVRVLVDQTGNPAGTGTTAQSSSYTLSNGGTVVFAPNSSTAAMTISVGKATSTTAPVANIVLVIDSTSTDYKASQNYKRVGYSFRQ